MDAICPEDELDPIHPGEILAEEFLKPLAITQYRLSKGIGVPPVRINEFIHEKPGITADTALRLAKFFWTTAEFRMNLQIHFNLEVQREVSAEQLEHIKMFQAAG